MLTERMIQEADLYSKGTKIVDIAKLVGVSRQTIYDDMKRPEWKAKVDECLAEAKGCAENLLNNDIGLYVAELKKIALTGKSEKNRMECLQYLLNRVYGTPTSKIEDITDKDIKDKIDKEQLSNEFEQFKLKKVE